VTAGWRPVARSDAVPAGAVVPAEVDGCELAVWRHPTGTPVVMAARCPHQWSHLAYEGQVMAGELVCRAHGWRFAADGRAVKVGMTGRRDDKGAIAVFPVREHDGAIEADLGTGGPRGLDGSGGGPA
jgi:phenylpropionate dioxygenase-like ring-hydroxylating dioxygenase large terminal subunit